MNEARMRRKAALGSLRSADLVQERNAMVRSKVQELLGLRFERTGLNPKIVGAVERDKYRIEKVIFESRPQVYVTASLYLPTSGGSRFPGILVPLGHSPNGKAYRSYQYAYQTLARAGYVVLAFDPFGQGERHQYLDPKTGQPTHGATWEHSQAGRPLLLLGENFAGYRAWDGIRALDYLLSRPEVDPERIGCTGQSGGGTMTMYLACLEPRIHVAVEVEGNSENLAGPNYIPPGAIADAEQNLVAGLPFGIDRGDLLIAFAPKPLLICYTPYDTGQTYSPLLEEATQEIFSEAKEVYRVLGAEEKIGLFASPLPHGLDFFNRRAIYRWFNRWLKNGSAEVDEAEFDETPDRVLECTTTGQVLTSLGGRSVVDLNIELTRAVLPESPFLNRSADVGAVREDLRGKLKHLLALPSERTSLAPQVLTSNVCKGTTLEFFQFCSEPSIRVPGWFVKPKGREGPVETVLFLCEGDVGDIVKEPGSLDDVIRRGYAVCAIELRGRGISAPHLPPAGPDYYWGERIEEMYAWANLVLGRPVLGQRVWDVLRALDYLESRPDVDYTHIHLLGQGANGLAALMAAVLDDRPRSVLLDHTVATYRSVAEAAHYALDFSAFVYGILREFDLPDLVGALSPRACWILNAADPTGGVLSESAVREQYSKRVALEGSAFKSVRFLVEPDDQRLKTYLSWIDITRP